MHLRTSPGRDSVFYSSIIEKVYYSRQGGRDMSYNVQRQQRGHLLTQTIPPYKFDDVPFASLISCSVTTLPWIFSSTSFPSSRMRFSFWPISETHTPFLRSGYDPTLTPSSFTRFCSLVRYGAIEDSGNLHRACGRQYKYHKMTTKVESSRREDLMSERPF